MTAPSQPKLAFTCSRHLISWLEAEHLSFVFTTYQTNRLFLIGLKPDLSLSIFERLLDRPMGLFVTRQRLYLSCRYQVWQFENCLADGELQNGFDRVYVPRLAYTTGDLDIHDVALTRSERPIFVNTLYSCLSTLSSRYSFIPVWQPPFISKLAPEDRCHLNGLALDEGKPAFVTAVSRSDVAAGWRHKRRDGGCVIDVASNEILVEGLSMPHSPRWYRDRLWLLNSGTGEFGYIDPIWQKFEPVIFCPGYLRGLAFHEHWAIVGLSLPRDQAAFQGLLLDELLTAKHAEPICGFMIIDINTGNIDHWIQIEGVITELYDLQILPRVRRPTALGFRTDEICHQITFPEPGELRAKAQAKKSSS